MVRKEVGEMRAITSELKDARTELLLSRLSLKEVADRLGGGASGHGVTTSGYHINRRMLRAGWDGVSNRGVKGRASTFDEAR